jgi:hypothetical protein
LSSENNDFYLLELQDFTITHIPDTMMMSVTKASKTHPSPVISAFCCATHHQLTSYLTPLID